MALKDILVHIDHSERCAARLDLAIGLAQAHEAHLTGVYVSSPPTLPRHLGEEIPAAVGAALAHSAEQTAREAEAWFRGRTQQAGCPAVWRSAVGSLEEVVTQSSRYADLSVVGQPPDQGARALRDLLERLVFASGRPVLVVPYAGAFPRVGENILVAWKPTREATRAVNDALPLLQRAKKVTVLRVNPKPDAGDGAGADIVSHLARHGVKAETEQTVVGDLAVGDVLLARLADRDADLLVMGAYGHSRLREMLLGGVTRYILQSMTVPVLMSH